MRDDTPLPGPSADESEWDGLFQKMLAQQEDPDPDEIARQVDEELARRAAESTLTTTPESTPLPPRRSLALWLRRYALYVVAAVVLLGGMIAALVYIAPRVWQYMAGGDTAAPPATTEITEGTAAPAGPTVEFDQQSPTSVTVGEMIELSITARDAAGPLYGKVVTWGTESPLNQVTVVQFPTDSTGESRFNFTWPTPGTVTVTAVVSDTVATLLLEVRPAPPPLAVRPALAEVPYTAGEPFKLEFHVDNEGRAPVSAVAFELTLPDDGVTLDEQRSPGCQQSGATLVVCSVGDVTPGRNVNSLSVWLLAQATGGLTLAPESYRLVAEGHEPVKGAAAISLVGAAALPPTPKVLLLSALPAELPADGTTPAIITVEVQANNGQPYTGAVTVRLGIPGEAPTPTPPAVAALECTMANFRFLRSSPEFLQDGPNIIDDLMATTAVVALAYNNAIVGTEWLYVRVSAPGDQNGVEGYVIETVTESNGASNTAVDCGADDYTTLPESPPTLFNQLERYEVELVDGQQDVTFTPGVVPGTVTISAELTMANGAPLTSSRSITLLETATMVRPQHTYDTQANAELHDLPGIVIHRLPGGTPLELYPLTEGATAREVAVRFWLPSTLLQTAPNGGTILAPTAVSQAILVGDGLDDPLNQGDGDRVLQPAAELRPIEVLAEDAANSLTLVRLRVWINVNDITLGGQ